MKNDIRNSGIKIIGNVSWGTHFCQFYQTKEDLMDILIPYLKEGLVNNELCIWVIPESLKVEDAKKALKKAIPDFDTYLDKEQIGIISCDNWYIKDGIFDSQKVLNGLTDKANQSLTSGYKGLRLVENICWRENDNLSDLVNYERKVDAVVDRYPIIALCTYPFDICSTTHILDIIASHQFVLARKDGKWDQIKNSGRKDIDECKQTEQKLQESEKRYRMLFTNMTGGFGLVEVIYNSEGKPYDYRYLEINPAFELCLGVKREHMLGRTMLEVFPNVSPIAIENYRNVVLSGKPIHFEIFSQITHKHLDIYAFSPEKGKLAFILRDITERKQIERELQESEKKYRDIIETASEGIWIGDLEARTTYVNKRMAEMAGYTQDEMIGKFAWDFTDEKGKSIIKKNFEKRQKGIDESYEFKFMRKDGSPLWTIVSSKSLFDSNRKFIGFMSMLTDITGRKEIEAKLKKTLDNLENLVKERTAELETAYNSLKESEKGLAEAQKMAHIGNWEWNITSDKAYWSEELYRIFKRNPQKLAPSYKEFLSYVHPADRDYVSNATSKDVNGKPSNIDFRIVLDSREERILHMRSEVVFDENKIPVRMKGIVQDITERKKAEEALKKMEKIRIKEIHHRIKNNLQVISSLLDLQAEAFSNLEVCKTPDVVEAFMESQSRVISMALIHEELYKGDKIDTLDFSAYLEKLTKGLFGSYNIGNKDISFELNLEQVYLGMDAAIPLGIIVHELVSNSFKHAFSASKRGEIQINLHRTETSAIKNYVSGQDEGCVEKKDFDYRLEVSDNGKGIPEKIDIENSASLGLQLVNILVEQIDGCIELNRGQGTRFTIWFNDIGI